MRHVEDLVDLLHLDDLGDDRFLGRQPHTLLQRTFGGQVMAQALAAVYATVAEDRLAHSLKGYFVRPGAPDVPITYVVTRSRDGGTFSSRRLHALQDDREIFMMTASFKLPEEGLEHAQKPARPASNPETCPPLAEVLGSLSSTGAQVWEQEWAALDTRYGGMDTHAGGTRMQIWFRARGVLTDDPRVHQMVLAYASDLTLLAASLVGHRGAMGSPRLQMATVDHSTWFHRPIRADRWVLYDQTSPNAANGLGLSFGRLYDADGILGASTAQEGLIRLHGE